MSTYSTLGWTLFALLLAPLIMGICLHKPRLVAGALLLILILFSTSTWGQLQVEPTIYSRGTGVFTFSLLNLILFVAGISVLLRRLANPCLPQIAPPMTFYLLAFGLLLVAHMVAGILSDVAIPDVLGYSGVINIFNMLLFMALLIDAYRSPAAQQKLLQWILVLALVRLAFGLVRFIWFEGDSANPYRNFEQMDLRIFFFDIADNFIAGMAAYWAAWRLASHDRPRHFLQRFALLCFLLLEIAAIALSYRRASLIGLTLVFGFLLWRLPPERRGIMLGGGCAILFFSLLLFFQQRLQFASHGEGFVASLVFDLTPKSQLEENRMYELWAAARSLGDQWLFGLGTWGSFSGDQEALSYHFGKLDFVHSGFGHILLKTGVIGVLLFAGLLCASLSAYRRRCQKIDRQARLLSDFGIAGLLFWCPTLLIGTPIIEFRSMLLLGLCLALPFLASRLQVTTSVPAYAHS